MASIEYYDKDYLKENSLEGNNDEWGYNGPGWYWWDEVWMWATGPYLTEKEASKAQLEYAKTI